ncbi:hypothetical protein CHARACLAT_018926 [Characodon lateralis]|uniref:Uncharacterized protein n=1 Tax=Characodon lateralis TaxID=208331 RepID=A0ABU7D857_9TELE|nr:hypothetical protein [Characodon lateralis]
MYNGELRLPSLTATQISQICYFLLVIVPSVITLHTIEPKLEQQMSRKGLFFITMLESKKRSHKMLATIELCLLLIVLDYCPTGGYFWSLILILLAKQRPSSVSKLVKIVVREVNRNFYGMWNVF